MTLRQLPGWRERLDKAAEDIATVLFQAEDQVAGNRAMSQKLHTVSRK